MHVVHCISNGNEKEGGAWTSLAMFIGGISTGLVIFCIFTLPLWLN